MQGPRSVLEPAELALLANVKQAQDAHVHCEEIQLEKEPEGLRTEKAKHFRHIVRCEAAWEDSMNKWVARMVKSKDDAHQNYGNDILNGRFEDRGQNNQRIDRQRRVFHCNG